jgi:ferredoxin
MEEQQTISFVGVDREICQTAATCLAYRMYELDDESKAVLLTKNGLNSDDPSNPMTDRDGFVRVDDLVNDEQLPLEELRALVLESAKACPFNAIIVRDAEGKQIWPPLD